MYKSTASACPFFCSIKDEVEVSEKNGYFVLSLSQKPLVLLPKLYLSTHLF